MTKQRRTFTPEFKREAACLVLDQGYSHTEAARSLGLVESALRRCLLHTRCSMFRISMQDRAGWNVRGRSRLFSRGGAITGHPLVSREPKATTRRSLRSLRRDVERRAPFGWLLVSQNENVLVQEVQVVTPGWMNKALVGGWRSCRRRGRVKFIIYCLSYEGDSSSTVNTLRI